MSETTDPYDQPRDPADALAASGRAEEKADPTSALGDLADSRADPAEALAAGPASDDDAPAGEQSPEGTLSALDELAEGRPDALEALDAGGDGEEEVVLDDEVGAAGAGGRGAFRPAHRPASARARADAAGHAYRRTMIPLMIVVGGLLVLVGVIGAVMVLGSDAGSGDLRNTRLALMTLVSFPLAGILFFGAWVFHREVKGK